MKFIILVKATQDSENAVMPGEDLMAEMATFHEQLVEAGVLVDASGLKPSSAGWRIMYNGSERAISDGPFAETKELVAGYTIINVESREEAREWTKRFPNPSGAGGHAQIEVRQIIELDDFEPSETLERFKKMESDRRG